jgi:hypothetical protein
MPPALITSSRILLTQVNWRPLSTLAEISNWAPWQIAPTGFPDSTNCLENFTASS